MLPKWNFWSKSEQTFSKYDVVYHTEDFIIRGCPDGWLESTDVQPKRYVSLKWVAEKSRFSVHPEPQTFHKNVYPLMDVL